MSEVLWWNEQRIDRASQRMLRRLGGGEWVHSSSLREAGDLDENTQVFYRMEEYLKPSGLVVEAARSEEGEARRFRLTEEGEEWVEEHADEIQTPATREEVAELAHEGYKAGTSAKESVQNYRKKVNRLKNRLDETRDEIGEITERQEKDARTLDVLWQRSEDNRDRSKESRELLRELEESVEVRATVGSVEGVSEDVSGVERRLATVESKQGGLVREQAEMARSRALLGRLAKPAGYVAAGVLVAYLVVLVAVLVLAPGLLVSALVGGITGVLGVVVGIGVVIYSVGGEVDSFMAGD